MIISILDTVKGMKIMSKKGAGSLLRPIWPLLGMAVGLVVVVVLSTLSIADAISTDLADAATAAAGFLSIIALLAGIKALT